MYKYLIFICILFSACAADEVTTTFDDGSIKEVFSVNKEGQKDGVYKLFREDGTLYEESNYSNDQLNGLRRVYFPDGVQVEIEELYDHDVMEGEHLVYYPSGSKLIEVNFTEGKMNGLLTKYFEDGNVQETVTFVDNVEMGAFKEYYANGQVQWEGSFLNGDTEFGLLKQFDESGELIKKMMCDSLGVCQTIWTPEKGDIDIQNLNLSKPKH